MQKIKNLRSFLSSSKLYNFSDKKRSLYERLGGENKIYYAIDLFKEKMMADQALRKYFIQKNEKFISDHQQRAMLVTFGGDSGFSKEDIKKMHHKLDLHEKEFSLFLDHLRSTFSQMNIDEETIKESLDILKNYHNLIICDPLIVRIGGEEKLKKILEHFYTKVVNDKELKSFYTAANLPKLIENQTRFLSICFGGNTKYFGQDVKWAHRNFNLNDRHFFVFKMHFAKSLRSFNLSEHEVIDKSLHYLEETRHLILNRKTAFEILGGEYSITVIVEKMFQKILLHPMLGPYFKDKNFPLLIKNFSAFLIGELGGPKTSYKGQDIKVLHSRMSLTDFHLDAMRDCLEKVLQEQNIEKSTVRDIVWALEKQRREVCASTIYDIIGGEETVLKATNLLVKKIRSHYLLGKFFEKKSEEEIKLIVRVKLVYALSGPRPFRGRDIKSAHQNVFIGENHFKDMKFLVAEALREVGVTESIILQILRVFDSKKSYILTNSK